VTISLLPSQLIPYRKYPIKTAIYMVDTWRRLKENALDALENIFVEPKGICLQLFDSIDIRRLKDFIQLFRNALTKYKIWQNKDCLLKEFIASCRRDNYRRAKVLALEYYSANGGYENNSHFLFGTASQFRRLTYIPVG